MAGTARYTQRPEFSHRTRLDTPQIPLAELISPSTPEEIEAVRALIREYAQSLGVDLCFQSIDEELATLPGEYAAPRGALYMAVIDGKPAACVAMRRLDNADYPNAAEMKRLYVRDRYRGSGLGRELAQAVLDAALEAGYSCVLLDTLDDMEAARSLYEDLGFHEIPPYYHNPIPGAHYLKADLEAAPRERRRAGRISGFTPLAATASSLRR
jgi:ribosomal protein S18 acetylase RimI-like enzyme